MFLRDPITDQNSVHKLLKERFAELREGSPNRPKESPKGAAQPPVMHVYVTSDEKGDDVQSLLDLLLAAARSAPASTDALKKSSAETNELSGAVSVSTS